MDWKKYVRDLSDILDAIVVTDSKGDILEPDAGFSKLADHVRCCGDERRRTYFIGNGASASMACHFSTDLAKMSGVPTEVFTDPSLITATGNDMGYEESFAYPLSQRMVAGELLVAISSSGNSPNIVRGIEEARKVGGRVVTFSAMSPDNTMRSMGDLNFYLPAETYGMAESGHAVLLHHLIDQFGG